MRRTAAGRTTECRVFEVEENFIGQGAQDELYGYFN